MKRLLVLLTALLISCTNLQPNAQLKFAYDTVTAYTEATSTALMRGRITPDQAEQASKNAKKAKEAVDTASVALARCQAPCDPRSILEGLRPTLFELERELRAREQK